MNDFFVERLSSANPDWAASFDWNDDVRIAHRLQGHLRQPKGITRL